MRGHSPRRAERPAVMIYDYDFKISLRLHVSCETCMLALHVRDRPVACTHTTHTSFVVSGGMQENAMVGRIKTAEL